MPNYKGIPIRAAPGLHEDCFEIVQSVLSPGARVLDIAAGAGAFATRLRDAGYDVHANDIDQDGWVIRDIPKSAIDLNLPLHFSLLDGPYDLIVAMEIIEHLQNPTKLLIDCKNLVKPGGYILFSTPNVLDMDSRFAFLRRGELYHFGPRSYAATGHMTILPCWLLELLFAATGLKVVRREFGGYHLRGRLSLQCILGRLLTLVLRPLMKTRYEGELVGNYIAYLLKRDFGGGE